MAPSPRPGHPDHVRTHRVTALAVRAAGNERLHPGAGAPWRPCALHLATHPHSARATLARIIGARRAVHTVADDEVTALDVSPWLDQKVVAVLAHHSEVQRGALPGLVASLPVSTRRELLATEWYVRQPLPV